MSAADARVTTRAVVLISPIGRQMAVLAGRPAGLRVRRAAVEVLRPPELRAAMAEIGSSIAGRHR